MYEQWCLASQALSPWQQCLCRHKKSCLCAHGSVSGSWGGCLLLQALLSLRWSATNTIPTALLAQRQVLWLLCMCILCNCPVCFARVACASTLHVYLVQRIFVALHLQLAWWPLIVSTVFCMWAKWLSIATNGQHVVRPLACISVMWLGDGATVYVFGLLFKRLKFWLLLQWVIYSTNSWVGGRNNALGIIFLVMGGLAFVTAVIFFCSYHLNKKRRAFADPSNLSWNQPERHWPVLRHCQCVCSAFNSEVYV